MTIRTLEFDAIIIGGGGSGMRAALQLAQSGYKTAIITKVFPTRSHTVSAQGGITCSIASADPTDDWRWHMYDTVKGSDYIGDQEAIEYMCTVGPEAVFELDHMGLPFSRIDNGRIYQRPFGGQSREYDVKQQAARTCAAADRTGHALLHTLYQGNIKNNTTFLNEWFAVDVVKNQDGMVCGVIALCMETGETVYVKAKATVFATGGAGRIYASTTNAHINTGDGIGMALRADVPVQDIEMWQFHPTGIHGAGVLVTEGCRGEGGFLVNKDGERFMERYAPNVKDLASRDVVARSIMLEILEGRGCGPKGDHVYLKLDHLGKEALHSKLPGICELSITFAQSDPVTDPIPVVPTCHYMMGGIPTNIDGQALTHIDGEDKVIDGLYACGEIACVSVHGANRLGGNSLLDLVVFGRASGMYIEKALGQGIEMKDPSSDDIEYAMRRVNKVNSNTNGESASVLRAELQEVMQNHFGVFRKGDIMSEGIEKLQDLEARIQNVTIEDKSLVYNTARIEALELQNLFETAQATAISANAREESRGAHARDDFPERDDENWLSHSMFYPKTKTVGKRPVNNQPLTVDTFEPKKRVY
jgi:succinate dehydrogenase / fumarate reductase, flavoprotein subunit